MGKPAFSSMDFVEDRLLHSVPHNVTKIGTVSICIGGGKPELKERKLAAQEENVVIKAGDAVLTLMPRLGGKIASIRVQGHELLQAPLLPYSPRTKFMGFDEADASGWDECLPSVAGCSVQTAAGQAHIPDHGDLWRLPWQVLQASEDAATLRVNGFSLPLQLTRSIIFTETQTGYRLQLLYSLTNLGAYDLPWSWAAHPLYAVDAGDRILLPESVQFVRVEGSGNHRLGLQNSSIAWPIATTPAGDQVDLSTAAAADSGFGDKLFAGPFQSKSDGWATLERPKIGLRLTVRFEPALTPYLGLWLCYGGWPDAQGQKQVCVALEPATAPVDSLATTGPWSRVLEPGETCTWPMELAIDRMN
jgi:galactose mutarotase-like enzyme